jgi:hypothetical protein
MLHYPQEHVSGQVLGRLGITRPCQHVAEDPVGVEIVQARHGPRITALAGRYHGQDLGVVNVCEHSNTTLLT